MNQSPTPQPTQLLPFTVTSIADDLKMLGVAPGMVLLVHTSLSKLGWVCGGAVAVIQAVQQVVGIDGTLVMPTFSAEHSDPSYWNNPPVPESWWTIIREEMPGYDPNLTPTRKMGAVAECFRKFNGVVRSNHPQVSFAAWGVHAADITNSHSLDYGLGESSPLARIYDLHGFVLLLGVGHHNNSSLHLAEYRANWTGKEIARSGAPLMVNGQRQWITQEDLMNPDVEDFKSIGETFANEFNCVKEGTS